MIVPKKETKDWEKTYRMIEKEIDEAVSNLKFIIFKRLKP